MTMTGFEALLQNLQGCAYVSVAERHAPHQHEVRRVKSVSGRRVPHPVETHKHQGPCQLGRWGGRGAFSDFLGGRFALCW